MSTSPAGPRKRFSLVSYVQNSILVGIFTAAPLVVTWFVLAFLFEVTASVGRPAITFIARRLIAPLFPNARAVLDMPAIESVLAVLFVILGLLALGILARQVVGRRLVQLIFRTIDRVPLANRLYRAVHQLVEALQREPTSVQRVVLIDFPSPEMKTVGIVTRTMVDPDTGEALAAVFVPTTPNPTNGYLEVVPVAKLTMLNMSFDDAMSFVISGGAVGPEALNYSKSYIAPNTEEGGR